MKRTKISLALLAALTLQAPTFAMAEEETSTKEEKEQAKKLQKEAEIEVIVVGGMRASEVAAINMKRFADTISDNLSAEEIGALPDMSIAESLERLTGVAGNQDNGRSNSVHVRGMGSQYTLTTLNNREIVSSFGGRSANLSLFPSASIRKAQVYKTSRADGLEGGIAGQVNMETFKPLEVDRNIRSFSATLSGNDTYKDLNLDDKDKIGKRADFMFSQHLSDTFAIAIGGSTREDLRYIESIKGGGIITNLGWPTDWNDDGVYNEIQVPAGVMNSKLFKNNQDSIFAAMQWQLTDDFMVSVDYLKSDYTYNQQSAIMSHWGIGSSDTVKHNASDITAHELELLALYGKDKDNFILDQNGDRYQRLLVDPALADIDPNTNYVMSGMSSVNSIGKWDADVDNEDHTEAYGINFALNLTDDFSVELDLAHSSADRVWAWNTASSKIGEGLKNFVAYDLSDDTFGFEYLGSGSYSAFDQTTYTLDRSQLQNILNNPEFMNLNELTNNHNTMDSAISAAKLDFSYYVDLGPIYQFKFGVRQSRNTKVHVVDGEKYGRTDAAYADLWTDIDEASLVRYLSDNTYAKLDDIVGYDVIPYIKAGDLLSELTAANDGPLPREIDVQDKFEGYDIEENTQAAYFQASFQTDWFDGIIGVRYYKTELEATSFKTDFSVQQSFDAGTGEPIPGQFETVVQVDAEGNVLGKDVTALNDYSGVLPTLNVNFNPTDEFKIRLGVGKAMIRPTLTEIHSGLKLKDLNSQEFNSGERSELKSLGEAGNPFLDPIESTQADISFEYYPSKWDYYSLAFFYKDMDGIYEQSANVVPVEGATTDDGLPIELPVTSYVKAEGGDVKGIEFSFRQNIGAGFAINGNYMDFIHGAVQDYNKRSPGQSPVTRPSETYYQPVGWYDETYNIALTYDHGKKFSARINVNHQESQSRRDGQDYSIKWPSTNVSVNVKYKIGKHITVFAQAANLLDEATTSGQLSSDHVGVPHKDFIFEQTHQGISYYAGIRGSF